MKGDLAAVEEPHQRLHQSAKQITEAGRNASSGGIDRQALAAIYDSETLPALLQVQGHLKQINDVARANILSDEAMIANAGNFRNLLLIVGVVSLVVGVVLAIVIVRGITRPLAQAIVLVEEIARGDFSKRLRMQRRDEIGKLALALDSMAESFTQQAAVAEEISKGNLSVEVKLSSEKDQLGRALDNMVVKLRVVIDQVRGAIENVSSGSQAMSASSEEMASIAEELSGQAEQLSDMIAFFQTGKAGGGGAVVCTGGGRVVSGREAVQSQLTQHAVAGKGGKKVLAAETTGRRDVQDDDFEAY